MKPLTQAEINQKLENFHNGVMKIMPFTSVLNLKILKTPLPP